MKGAITSFAAWADVAAGEGGGRIGVSVLKMFLDLRCLFQVSRRPESGQKNVKEVKIMPRRDGTGPPGQNSRTRKRLGRCNLKNRAPFAPVDEDVVPGQGQGAGLGRGKTKGAGRGAGINSRQGRDKR